MHDLAVITVSTNEANWLRPCLTTLYEHIGDIDVDVVIVDNESTDGTRELIENEFPQARIVSCVNRGFSHANNRALMSCDARYVLFLNPDTEIVSGTFAELVALMDARPGVGLAGVRQLLPDRSLYASIRRFPSPMRALGEALASERLPIHPSWFGEREVDPAAYDREFPCDWTSGSFMLARREALESGGYLDERFFMSSEEIDLCLRIKQAGWAIHHLPHMTIIHHADKRGVSVRMDTQYAYARRQYAYKHFSGPSRTAFLAATALKYGLRAAFGTSSEDPNREERKAFRMGLRALLGAGAPPFGPTPHTAVCPRATSPTE